MVCGAVALLLAAGASAQPRFSPCPRSTALPPQPGATSAPKNIEISWPFSMASTLVRASESVRDFSRLERRAHAGAHDAVGEARREGLAASLGFVFAT